MKKIILAGLLAMGLLPAAALADSRHGGHDHDGGRRGTYREERSHGGRYDDRRYFEHRYHGRIGHGGYYHRVPEGDRCVRVGRDHVVHYRSYHHVVRHGDHTHVRHHVRRHVHHEHD